jgi:Zn finger protein HypA/HybF involved in hydrogenase expression
MATKNHEFSSEIIYHFVCGECKNWWSHATDMIYTPVHQMSCPHCGVKRTIIRSDYAKNESTQNPRWERDIT